jgi:hypothetical protein
MSSPSNAHNRAESVRQRIELLKARLIERKNAIRRRHHGGGGDPDPDPNVGVGSWRPRICAHDCGTVPPNSSSFTSSGNQIQLLLAVTGTITPGCDPDEVGAQIDLPSDTPVGSVSFEKIVDSESESGALVVRVIAFDSSFNPVAAGSLPNSVSGAVQTYDLLNPLPDGGFGAQTPSPGAVMRYLLLVAEQRTTTSTGTIRIQNVLINGVPLKDNIMQQAGCGSFN